ncbi:DUF983 domain-containing protein [Muricauda sp. TY007]|uniref:DUF983 domain-containing protein n=1 Tax=Allomuricauda sp. TY007 TaxID=2683200 RepID=UPI0013C1DB40|nr:MULTISPECIES: DUF983 domain-containing protein [unclassified Allomuricauda]MBA4744807.1 DUF983 domain-containing protein [Allomuricauda sp.]NDV16874.1 DUF983 domain-containing protein [Muricauda sp. TY007]
MLKKGTKMYSILTGNCPRCHQESMYEKSNPYTLSKIFSMNERCSHCGLKYKIEPSFFYGAMYVSYGVGIAFAVAAFVISFLFIGTSLLTTFIAIVGTLIVFMPVIIRLSRNIWINFFVKYDPTSVKKHEAVKS